MAGLGSSVGELLAPIAHHQADALIITMEMTSSRGLGKEFGDANISTTTTRLASLLSMYEY